MLFPKDVNRALTRLLIDKGIFAKEEFWELVRVIDREMEK